MATMQAKLAALESGVRTNTRVAPGVGGTKRSIPEQHPGTAPRVSLG